MYKVGEFAKLAHVSSRLLRYYDEIDLLKPAYVDQSTGYRYYHAEQMASLNRIIVLKDLGLSLDQIRRMLNDNVSTDEMQGMLLLKKAEIEQEMLAELKRLRRIEARMQAIRDRETNKPVDVVVKQIDSHSALSVRSIFESFETALAMHSQIRSVLPDKSTYGLYFTICHDEDPVDRDMDLEIGCILEADTHAPVLLSDNLQLCIREFPPIDMMATTVVTGAIETIHTAYGDVALWAQENQYRLAGTPREITLKHAQESDGRDLVTEIQFPIKSVRADKISNS